MVAGSWRLGKGQPQVGGPVALRGTMKTWGNSSSWTPSILMERHRCGDKQIQSLSVLLSKIRIKRMDEHLTVVISHLKLLVQLQKLETLVSCNKPKPLLQKVCIRTETRVRFGLFVIRKSTQVQQRNEMLRMR